MNHHLFIQRLGVSDFSLPAPRSLPAILKCTASDHGSSSDEILGTSRLRCIAWARQDFMWRARQVRKANGEELYSLPRIGQFLGGKDHTTVLHGVRAHAKRLREARAAG
jgi:chromosomal replication initiator protein